MAKGKNVNPADAFRKAQRKKELKKNKAERQKTRDFALVKKDTSEIEDEITKLEATAEPSAEERARLKKLNTELVDIKKKKEEYVEAHPEQRKLVYASARRREQQREDDEEGGSTPKPPPAKRNLFKKNGLPRHPERSVYYDPVMNPFGMPPPGMPYVERALLPGEVDSEAEQEQKEESEDDDDDIAMPEGPPPGQGGEEVESDDDDIPMPEGPPPGKAASSQSAPPLPPTQPPLPSGPPPGVPSFAPPLPLPLPVVQPFIPSPPSFLPPPPGFAAPPPFPPFPPPVPGFGHPLPPPPPPPGFFPRRAQASHAALQDPLAPIPQTQLPYQAHRAAILSGGVPPPPLPPPPPSSLPHNPNLPPRPTVSAPGAPAHVQKPAELSASATISAEPELRDLKKESTAFVPSSLKRKKGGGGGGSRVNAAPVLDDVDGDKSGGAQNEDTSTAPGPQRPDLLDTLQEMFGPLPSVETSKEDEPGTKRRKTATQSPTMKKAAGADDYDKFMDEMKDLLGPGTT